MKRKRLTKADEKLLREQYRRYCKIRYYTLLFLYFWEECSKLYAYIAPLLIVFGILPKMATMIITPIAMLGSVSAFTGKWIHLKNTKFRKKGFFDNGEK